MGIRFNSHSKSWRAPLQLIDSWLPVRSQRLAAQAAPSRAIQLFTRAGWLNTSPAMMQKAQARDQPCLAQPRTPNLRLVRAPAKGSQIDTRLVISGRIGEVCAELDRLVALERTGCARHA